MTSSWYHDVNPSDGLTDCLWFSDFQLEEPLSDTRHAASHLPPAVTALCRRLKPKPVKDPLMRDDGVPIQEPDYFK